MKSQNNVYEIIPVLLAWVLHHVLLTGSQLMSSLFCTVVQLQKVTFISMR